MSRSKENFERWSRMITIIGVAVVACAIVLGLFGVVSAKIATGVVIGTFISVVFGLMAMSTTDDDFPSTS